MSFPQQQRGVALITAILLVSVATMLGMKLAWDNQISMRRTESLLSMEQARLFALGAEAVAIDILRQDELEYDHAGEDWAQITPPLEIGIDATVLGQMQGYLTDAQGKFNLNNLVPSRGGEPDENARKQFTRLIEILSLDSAIVDSVIDWIDADTIPLALGAEDGVYTGYSPPYRAANNYMTNISELRSIANIDDEAYTQLLPHVTALHPDWCSDGSITPINLNAASAEVLQSIHEEISAGQAQTWFEERGDSGWESWNDISDWGEEYTGLQGAEVTLKSNCFGLNVLVNVGSSVLSMYSLIDRTNGGQQFVTRIRTFGLE